MNNFAVLTLTFTDSSNTPQTDVSVILKDSTKKVLSENSGVEEIKYFLRPGTYFVDASVGDARVEDVQITVNAGANSSKIVFATEETGEARIIVKMTDGTPIPESHAKLLLGTEEIASAWGSNQGIIELSASPGTYKLEVRMEVINELLKLEDEITIEAGEIATKEVVFENVGMLTLTFEDGSGNPLSDVTVIIKDSDKNLLSENSLVDEISYLLKPGTYYVDASIGDESLEDVEITVSAGANTRKIVFAAEETGEARIIVKMTDGTPIPESHAKLLLGTEEIAAAWGSEQGIIELSASPGTYKLEVRMEVINELLKHEDEITIEAGEIATKEVVFENVGMLTLTFEDSNGIPLSDVTVILKDSDKQLLSENSFMEEISYLLKPGTYYVDAEKLGVKVENHEIVVTAGAQTATISVPLVTIGNVAAGKEYRMVKPPQPQYADSSGKKLTDGEYATSSYLDPAWVGTLGEGEGQGENEFWQILVLDLGEKYDILGIWLECLRDDESGIKTPKRLRVAVSENRYTWNLLPWKDFPEPENLTVAPLSYEAITSARFVAFYIEQRWNWLFMSEVEVRGILGGGTPVDGDLDAIELTPDIFLVP